MNEPTPRRLSRAETTEQTRRRLLTAAATVIARRGVAGASVDEIAETAGHTVGALYSHFGSKDKLVVEAMHAHVGEQVARARSISESGASDDEGNRRAWSELLAEVAGTGAESTPLFWAELWLHAARNPDLVELFAAHARAVDEVIVSSIRTRRGNAVAEAATSTSTDGVEDIGDEALATVVSSLFRGLTQRRRIDPDAVPEPLLGRALQLLVAGRQAVSEGRDGARS